MNAALPREGEISAGCHRCSFRVYYEDTDAGGVVYYANYLKIAERARTEMLRCLGVEQDKLRRESGVGLVVRRCSAEFIASARLDDELTVLTRLVAQAGAALDLAQEICRGEEILARLDSKIACLAANGRPTRLPAPLLAALATFTRHPQTEVAAHAR